MASDALTIVVPIGCLRRICVYTVRFFWSCWSRCCIALWVSRLTCDWWPSTYSKLLIRSLLPFQTQFISCWNPFIICCLRLSAATHDSVLNQGLAFCARHVKCFTYMYVAHTLHSNVTHTHTTQQPAITPFSPCNCPKKLTLFCTTASGGIAPNWPQTGVGSVSLCAGGRGNYLARLLIIWNRRRSFHWHHCRPIPPTSPPSLIRNCSNRQMLDSGRLWSVAVTWIWTARQWRKPITIRLFLYVQILC